ncbi:MAG TPA: sigma-70 family RNA polymerase sigma factor [Puia sp.]|nr:sigma-70 family RNA polymerase sigma factor [Puia sp.]
MIVNKELLFTKLIKDHSGIVFGCMKKYNILMDHIFFDDYVQEIYLEAWNRFQKFEYRDDQSFSVWLWQSVAWTILHFYRNCKRWTAGLPDKYVIPDEWDEGMYEETDIDGLYRAIESFNDTDRQIFKLYAHGLEICEISQQVNMTKPAITHRLNRGYERIRENAHNYFDVVPRMRKQAHMSRRNGNNKSSKPIIQYTRDGELVKEFPSIGEVGRAGWDPRRVGEVANGKKKSYKGFIFKFSDQKQTA